MLSFGPFKRYRQPVRDHASGMRAESSCTRGKCPHAPAIIGSGGLYALVADGLRASAWTRRKNSIWLAGSTMDATRCRKCQLKESDEHASP